MLEAVDLRKTFPPPLRGWRRRPVGEATVAVDGVSFRVGPGEVVGLLGPNGAGKTTAVRMLATLILPTSGTARVRGIDVVRRPLEARAHLGVMLGGERTTYWKLTGRENLGYFGTLYRVPPAVLRQRISEILRRFDLEEKADQLVERYSSGMKQRLALARAMLPDPPVLLLDEPTVGLDPRAARSLRDLIAELRADGRAVLLTTHNMQEADELSDRVLIIDRGRIIAEGTPQALKSRLRRSAVVRLELQGPDGEDPAGWAASLGLAGVERMASHRDEAGGVWELSLAARTPQNGEPPTELALAPIVAEAERRGLRVVRAGQETPTLESVFLALTGRRLGEGAEARG
ncbi:ABC transporter ATP-binding protein [Limnochorda pilosa]|uniref:ABC transporter ATP-binding protein n=1 Tax=Limnochorda pilosa TaxID=1555112 RepID=UPI000830A165|nr:ABC transporter ATP-binding protein [Limnochorda pilosa]